MTTYYEIPLTPNAQTFRITLAGVQYVLAFAYRTHAVGGWFLDIYSTDGVALVAGIPLVTGVDLLEPYPDLDFGGSLFVATDGDPSATPTYTNLGTQAHVYFGSPS